MQTKHLKLLGIFLLSLASLKGVAQEQKLKVDMGGFLRFTYNNSSWKDAQQARGGDLGYDCFGIKANATYDKLYMALEYRFYEKASGGPFMKFGYFGYKFNEETDLKFGLVPVPFGNAEVNSNSFFYSVDYFLGLEDEYDTGLLLTKKINKLRLDFALFKNAEDLSMGNSNDAQYNRFGYDVTSFEDETGKMIYRNKEINNINARAIYSLKNHDLGASLLYGQLFNLDTEKFGSRFAWAAHYNGNYGRFNLKAEVAGYDFQAKNPAGQSADVIAMASYGAPYLVASEAINYTISLAYRLPVKSKLFDSFTFYNDFGLMDKANVDFENTLMNDTGILIAAGPIYTYIDWAMGKNQAWFGPEWAGAFAQGNPDAKWHYRFNINFGFYF